MNFNMWFEYKLGDTEKYIRDEKIIKMPYDSIKILRDACDYDLCSGERLPLPDVFDMFSLALVNLDKNLTKYNTDRWFRFSHIEDVKYFCDEFFKMLKSRRLTQQEMKSVMVQFA